MCCSEDSRGLIAHQELSQRLVERVLIDDGLNPDGMESGMEIDTYGLRYGVEEGNGGDFQMLGNIGYKAFIHYNAYTKLKSSENKQSESVDSRCVCIGT